MRSLQERKEELSKVYQSNESSPYFAHYAECLLNEGHIDTAVQVCSKGIEFHPENSNGYYVLGLCYTQLGDIKNAKLNLERCLKYFPSHSAAYEKLIQINDEEGLTQANDVLRQHFYTTDPLSPALSGPKAQSPAFDEDDFDASDMETDFAADDLEFEMSQVLQKNASEKVDEDDLALDRAELTDYDEPEFDMDDAELSTEEDKLNELFSEEEELEDMVQDTATLEKAPVEKIDFSERDFFTISEEELFYDDPDHLAKLKALEDVAEEKTTADEALIVPEADELEDDSEELGAIESPVVLEENVAIETEDESTMVLDVESEFDSDESEESDFSRVDGHSESEPSNEHPFEHDHSSIAEFTNDAELDLEALDDEISEESLDTLNLDDEEVFEIETEDINEEAIEQPIEEETELELTENSVHEEDSFWDTGEDDDATTSVEETLISEHDESLVEEDSFWDTGEEPTDDLKSETATEPVDNEISELSEESSIDDLNDELSLDEEIFIEEEELVLDTDASEDESDVLKMDHMETDLDLDDDTTFDTLESDSSEPEPFDHMDKHDETDDIELDFSEDDSDIFSPEALDPSLSSKDIFAEPELDTMESEPEQTESFETLETEEETDDLVLDHMDVDKEDELKLDHATLEKEKPINFGQEPKIISARVLQADEVNEDDIVKLEDFVEKVDKSGRSEPKPTEKKDDPSIFQDELLEDELNFLQPQQKSTKKEDVADEENTLVSPTLGEIYMAQGRFQEARDVFSQLLSKKPSDEKLQRKINDIDEILGSE